MPATSLICVQQQNRKWHVTAVSREEEIKINKKYIEML